MGKALVFGLQQTVRRWPVVVFLYAALLAPALLFGAVTWARFQAALDRSLAGRTLLKDLDLNVFLDLFVHRRDLFVAVGIAGVVLGAGTIMVWIWLHASVIAAASDDENLGEALRRGTDLFPRFFRLWLISLVVNTAIAGLFYFIARALLAWTADGHAEMTPYWVIGGCGLAAALLLLLSMVVHDHARIHVASTDVEAAPAYRWSLRFCLRDERRALLLALAILGTGFAVWAVYQSIAMLIPPTSPPGVIASLVWGQALILARAIGRFWYFAAANDLQASAAADWVDDHLPIAGE